MKPKLHIKSCTVTSALGHGLQAHQQALSQQRTGLRHCDFDDVTLETWIGRVDGIEQISTGNELADYDCRNNRLALMGLQQDNFLSDVAASRSRHGQSRIGVFIGTSTSGVLQTEHAYAQRDANGHLPADYKYRTTHNLYAVADYVQQVLKLKGPAHVISTACSSSAKVFATAYRYMHAGLCDAALVGGVDSLCQMTLYGFNALQLISPQLCCPADINRNGINIGEAAGFALLEWADDDSDICLLGYGESSDAYHMSSPHPQGAGALLAMEQALTSADLTKDDIDYINLHGTATPANDIAEDHAVYNLFQGKVPCSSTKGFTGHTLGAAGILEAAISYIAVKENLLPVSLNTQQLDTEIRSNIILSASSLPQSYNINTVMSNSFGFGGNNSSLVIGRLKC